jgi:hypothetical protein
MSMDDEIRQEGKEVRYMEKNGLDFCHECGDTFPESDIVNGECPRCRCPNCGGDMELADDNVNFLRCVKCMTLKVWDSATSTYQLTKEQDNG